jgi:acid-sensing ion channel, other
MKEMMARREELILGCFFRLNALCVENFTEVITEEGVCYTFNGVNLTSVYREVRSTDDSQPSEQWTLEEGYKPGMPLRAYPFRALSSGAYFGLSLVVRLPDLDFDPFCKGPTPGFTIVMHTPQAIPAVSLNSISVGLNQEITIKLKPKSIITSDNLKKYSYEV